MGERNLSRQLATSIVDALKSEEHILVVKGGSEALVREIDGLVSGHLPRITPRLMPQEVVGEVTSTFGHEDVDEAVEDMVTEVSDALMDSDHVEDVFAEDNVIRRDIFRVVRDALRASIKTGELFVDEEEEAPTGPISVRLGTLGYVASTVAKLADDATLRDALERAALASEGQLTGFDPKGEATFDLHDDDPDARLELEEAVADELENLVDMGLVDLPRLDRRVSLPRDMSAEERTALRPKIDAIAQHLLAGRATSWALVDPRTLKLSFTPLSEQDTRAVDVIAATFGREVSALLAKMAPVESEAPAPKKAQAKVEAPPSEPPPAAKKAPAKKAAAPKKAAAKEPAEPKAKKTAATKAPAKKAAAKKTAKK